MPPTAASRWCEEPGHALKSEIPPAPSTAGAARPRQGQHLRLRGPGSFSEALTLVAATSTWSRCAPPRTLGRLGLDQLRPGRPPLRACIRALRLDHGRAGSSVHAHQWWRALGLPVNWKLAEGEPSWSSTTSLRPTPSWSSPSASPPKDLEALFDPLTFIGSASCDCRRGRPGAGAWGRRSTPTTWRWQRIQRDIEACPPSPKRSHGAVTGEWPRRRRGGPGTAVLAPIIPDLQRARRPRASARRCTTASLTTSCSPRARASSSYRWSPSDPKRPSHQDLVSSPATHREEEPPGRQRPPEAWAYDDERVPPHPHPGLFQPAAPAEGPAQQETSSSCGCLRGIEGGIANFERTLDGFLADLSYMTSWPRPLRAINLNPLERPVVDLGF